MDKEPCSAEKTPNQLEAHEQRAAKAGKSTLLNNIFIRFVFRYKLACQHVPRVLTGIQNFTVKAINDGTETANPVQCYKMVEPIWRHAPPPLPTLIRA